MQVSDEVAGTEEVGGTNAGPGEMTSNAESTKDDNVSDNVIILWSSLCHLFISP